MIRCLVDPQAHLLWLTCTASYPGDAFGFDLDGATFHHIGEHVIFEGLTASFDCFGQPAIAMAGPLTRVM